jgi:hypothetical protein
MFPYTTANKSLFTHTDQVSEQSIIRNDCGKQGMQSLVRKSEGIRHFADHCVDVWLIYKWILLEWNVELRVLAKMLN